MKRHTVKIPSCAFQIHHHGDMVEVKTTSEKTSPPLQPFILLATGCYWLWMGRFSDTISCPLDSELVQLGTGGRTSHFKEDTQIVSKNIWNLKLLQCSCTNQRNGKRKRQAPPLTHQPMRERDSLLLLSLGETQLSHLINVPQWDSKSARISGGKLSGHGLPSVIRLAGKSLPALATVTMWFGTAWNVDSLCSEQSHSIHLCIFLCPHFS